MARPKSKVEVSQTPVIKPDLGAGACLKFLQEQEAQAREPIQQAKDALDGILRARASRDARFDGKEDAEWDQDIRAAQTRLAIATEDHGKASERLLKYEKAVAPEKRDDGEKVTQKEAARILTLSLTHIRLGIQQCLLSACQNLGLAKNETDRLKILEPLFDQSVTSSVDNAASEGQLPQWSVAAIKEAL